MKEFRSDLEAQCHFVVFMRALFEKAAEEVSKLSAGNHDSLAEAWHAYLSHGQTNYVHGSNHEQFYRTVVDTARTVCIS